MELYLQDSESKKEVDEDLDHVNHNAQLFSQRKNTQ